jgi:hypothetical protein
MATTHITAADLKKHVNNLQAIGTQMEREGDPRWIAIAQAAALIESLRLGLTIITETDHPAPPRWIGLDMSKPGKDMTATFRRHSHA